MYMLFFVVHCVFLLQSNLLKLNIPMRGSKNLVLDSLFSIMNNLR